LLFVTDFVEGALEHKIYIQLCRNSTFQTVNSYFDNSKLARTKSQNELKNKDYCPGGYLAFPLDVGDGVCFINGGTRDIFHTPTQMVNLHIKNEK
jgi:hypothetical protein